MDAQGKDIVIPTEESKTIMRREEDLNGVNPLYAILGAGGAAAMSFGSWKVRREPTRPGATRYGHPDCGG